MESASSLVWFFLCLGSFSAASGGMRTTIFGREWDGGVGREVQGDRPLIDDDDMMGGLQNDQYDMAHPLRPSFTLAF